MKKRLLRLTAVFMFACMVVSSVPGSVVRAEETGSSAGTQTEGMVDSGNAEGTDQGNSGSDQNTTGETQEDTGSVAEGDTETGKETSQETEDPSAADEAENGEAVDSGDSASSDKETDQESEEEENNEQAVSDSVIEKKSNEINYVFVESPYLVSPGTERIVVSYGDGTEEIEQVTLTVEAEDGAREVWESALNVNDLYLFEKDFSDESISGTYEVISLNVTDASGMSKVKLSDHEIEALFGVNEEYDGIEELQPLAEDTETQAKSRTVDDISDVEATVAEIDPEDPEASTSAIVDALEEAETTVETDGKVSTSDDVKASGRTASQNTAVMTGSIAALGAQIQTLADSDTRSGDVVVALDPGHDSKHTGATGIGGLKEEVLTLKIANYCKEELEKYSGVKVYMTRTSAACPYPSNSSSGGDIGDRVQAAVKAGADIFVSIHLNSSTSSAANGAEIIVPNNNWKPDVAQEGRELAQAILDELKAVGVNMRPNEIYSKDTTINEKYPDGSKSDYFSVQIYAKEAGIPGITVEHAFLSNSNDVNEFLKTEAGLKKLGVADATGIAEYLGLEKTGEKVSIEEGTYILESALGTDKVANVANGSMNNQAAVTLNSNNDVSSQRFEIISAGSGYYYIIAEHSGKALDVRGGSKDPGTVIQQYTLNKSAAAQKWCFIDAGNGYYYLRSALGTYLDVKSGQSANGTPLQTYTLNQTNAQKWKLVKSDYQPVADGTYTFSSAAASDYVMDVASDSLANKANVQLYKSNDTSAQRFEVTYISDGYYKIVAEHSGKALDVTSGSDANGTNLQQYAFTNAKAQLWKFVDAGNGNYYIRSKCGTVIDYSSVSSGSNIYMYSMQGTSTQQWKLNKSNYRPVEDGKYVISTAKSDGYVMTESGSNIQLEAYSNQTSQKFDVKYVADGYYQIKSSSSGKSLDVANGSTSNKANLQTWNANGSKAQLWKFVRTSDGYYYIKSNLGTTIDLTSGTVASGTNIQMYSMADTQAQKWKLDSERANTSERPLEDGTYVIQNSTNTQRVFDVQSGSESNGGNIRLYQSNNTSSQRYEFTYVGNGYYKIQAERSGRVLDVSNGSKAAGANLQQYAWNGTDAQLWRIIDAGDGNYYIRSKLGTVVDINKATAVSGANVQMENLSGRNTQKWKIVKSPLQPISDGTYTFRISSSKNQVLDITSGSTANGVALQLYTYNATEAQRFEVTYLGEYYKIVSEKSGKALQYDKNNTGNGSKITQSDWTGADNQLWKFVQAKGGTGYYIKSKTGMVFDVTSGNISSGTKIQAYTMNGTAAQKWTLRKEEAVKTVNIPNGTYTIQTALNSARVLDVANGSTANKGNIRIYNGNDTDAQKFEITAVSDGYYKIISKKSGKAVEVANGSMVSGTNVQQYTWNGTNAQLWRFIDAGDGQYYIQSKLGTVLDVANGNSASRTNVQTYTMNKSTAQKWILDDNRAALYPIMGTTSVTKDQMVKFYNSKKVTYPYSNTDVPTIEQFCQIYIEECKAEGVKAEVAFAQAMKETGFLKFGGDVKPEQYNFAGLGAVGNGAAGDSFKDIRTGIRAQVQHLKAYASLQPLNQECVDTRFKYVKRGCAEYVQWLGMQENPNSTETSKVGWATAKNYGYDIVDLYIIPMKQF